MLPAVWFQQYQADYIWPTPEVLAQEARRPHMKAGSMKLSVTEVGQLTNPRAEVQNTARGTELETNTEPTYIISPLHSQPMRPPQKTQ
jgi:hypothetical protein